MPVTDRVSSLRQSENGSSLAMFASQKFRNWSCTGNSSRTPTMPQKLVCVLALFAAVLSVVAPALCAPEDCMPTNSHSSDDCQGMPMEKETGASAPSTPSHCCDFSQNPPPAMQTSLFQTLDVQFVTVFVLNISAPLVNVSESFEARSFAISPPPNLQSLICTFLI